MDPNNAQQNIPQVSPVVPSAAPGFPPQDSQKSNTNKNLTILVVVIFIGVVITGAIGAFLYLNTKPSSQTSITSYNPTPTVEQNAEKEVAVAEVKGASDLDSLLVELEKADSSLEKELTSLENDSNF